MIAKNFGEIPAAGALTADGPGAARRASRRRSATVGELIGRHRQKAALGEAMRTVADVNKYVSDSAPWKLKGDDERERLGTILHVTAQAVADCNLLLSPVPAAQRQRRRPRARRRRGRRADAGDPRGRRPRRRSGVPDPDRRLLGLPGLGAPPVVAGHAGGQADAGVHQARPLRGRRGARAARGSG